MAKSKGNNNAQFTYDFGIAIAQSTVNKITKLTGATLTLASAFYALKATASEYVDTLRENTLRFGGVLSTMKAMEQAQNRLIKGLSYFSVDDQLKGMNQLMAAGIDVGKNLEWINKAAHATGKSYAEFSGMIASAIQGNSQALVDAGLMTQRATRMFDKYAANTVMRQQAILNFVKSHKGLMNAIKNDFETIQDQMTRIKGIWKGFLQSIMGKPNDPQSFYGQIVSSMKMVANALARNMEQIKRYGYIIGQVLGWVIKQIGHFVVWVGRQVKKTLSSVWTVTDDFQNQARSLIVWLEFWKLKIVDFFKEYGGEIKMVLKLLIAYRALKAVFVVSDLAIASVIRYRKALAGMFLLQKKYLTFMGPAVGNKFTRWLQSLAAFMPRWLRRVWVSVGKFFERGIFGGGFAKPFKAVGKGVSGLKSLFGFLIKGVRLFFGFLKNIPQLFMAIVRAGKFLVSILLRSNPVGWIITAITLLGTLFAKSKKFREFIGNIFKMIWEALKLIWNSVMYIITWIMVGIKNIWNWFKSYIWDPIANFFKSVWGWISGMWDRFMNTAVGRWIDKWIITPLKTLFQWIVDAWNWVVEGIAKAIDWLSGANDKVSQATKGLAEKNGVPTLPTVGGGHYDNEDNKNKPKPNPSNSGTNKGKPNPGNSDIPTPTESKFTPTGNPMLSDAGSMGGYSGGGGGGGGNSTNMTFSNGAIQIVVQKGEGIDERILSQKVRGILNDMKREGDMRGGML